MTSTDFAGGSSSYTRSFSSEEPHGKNEEVVVRTRTPTANTSWCASFFGVLESAIQICEWSEGYINFVVKSYSYPIETEAESEVGEPMNEKKKNIPRAM